MFHFRQALLRMRQGDSDREIAASKVMGRRKAAALRQVASARGWLGAAQALPEDAEIAQAMSAPRRAARPVSSLQPWRGLIGQWAATHCPRGYGIADRQVVGDHVIYSGPCR